MPDSKHDNRPGEGTKKQRAQAKRAAGRRARHAALKAAIASEAASPGADNTVDASDTPKTASALPSILYRKRRSSVISETGLSPSDQQFNDYRRISGPGTVHVVDKDTEEPHIVVRITHYANMTSEDWVDFGPELSENGSEIAGIYQRRSRELAPMMLKNALNVSYTSSTSPRILPPHPNIANMLARELPRSSTRRQRCYIRHLDSLW